MKSERVCIGVHKDDDDERGVVLKGDGVARAAACGVSFQRSVVPSGATIVGPLPLMQTAPGASGEEPKLRTAAASAGIHVFAALC